MHRESANAIVASGSVPPLVALLESGDAGVQQDAAAALRNLAATSDVSPSAIGDAHGTSALVALLSSPCDEVKLAAAGALRTLAGHRVLVTGLLAEGASSALVVLAESPSASRELRAEARGALILLAPPAASSDQSSPRSISAEHDA